MSDISHYILLLWKDHHLLLYLIFSTAPVSAILFPVMFVLNPDRSLFVVLIVIPYFIVFLCESSTSCYDLDCFFHDNPLFTLVVKY